MQPLVNPRCGDDMKCANAEGVGGCFYAGADDDLGFVCEALLRFVFGWEFAMEDLVEDCVAGTLLGGFASEGASY